MCQKKRPAVTGRGIGNLLLCVAFGCIALWPRPARADGDEGRSYARFAFILGVNTSVDEGAPTLRYADDDAARYLELFRTLGARTYVLTRLDDNTRRLHPQLAAEALLPLKSEFDRTIAAAAFDVGQARRRHVKTVLYFVYAGHGSARDGYGYITLEDAPLDAATLDSSVVLGIGADQTHFIVDACDSYFLAMGRGPGGQRHEAHGFLRSAGLQARDSVGLLLSTSSARESHEWSAFQAGVFSHEVRSALYGAADADGDGQVSYREVAAFVTRANEAIPNEAYRTNVYARAPKDSPFLLDLRAQSKSRLILEGAHASHYFMEDSRGVRMADFHNDANQPMYVIRPGHTGKLYLRRLSDDVEFVVPNEPEVLELAELSPSDPRVRARGAAGDQFELLFALPFGRQAVTAFLLQGAERDAPNPPRPSAPHWWSIATGLGLVGAGAVGSLAGTFTLLSAHALALSNPSQSDVESVNDRIRSRNSAGVIELAAGGATIVLGACFLFWPAFAPHVDANGSASGARVSLRGDF